MSYIDDLEIIHNDDSTITINGEIPFTELQKHRSEAVAHLGKNMEVDGFRKGHVPESVIVEKVGEMNVISEMAERALAKNYPTILKTHNIDAIGYPQITVKKLAPEVPFGFTANVAVMPKVELPNYRDIASAHSLDTSKLEVTDEDIQKSITEVLRRKVAYERLQNKAAQKANAESTDLPTPESVKETEESSEPTDAELPELTDEVAQSLGNFASVDELKEKVKTELAEHKSQEAKNKHRATITDALIASTEVKVPDVLIQAEIEQFLGQMREDLRQAQLSMEDYLAHIKKTEDDLKSEWRPAAEKRAKVQLVLDAIATAEDITPDEKVVTDQVTALKQQYKDADESRIRTYVSSILRNEAVMKLLEGDTTATTEEKDTPSEKS